VTAGGAAAKVELLVYF